LCKNFNVFKDFKYVDGLVNYAGGDIGGNDNNASGGKPNQNNLFIKYKDMNIIYKRNYLSTLFMLRNFINKAKPYLGFNIEEAQDSDAKDTRKTNPSIGDAAQNKTFDTTFSTF
jgi:hypothetical protein